MLHNPAVHRTLRDKRLSVNNVDCQSNLAERDDRGGDVVECDEASLKLLVSHQQFAEAVEPTVENLDHPAARLLGWVAPLGIGLSAPTNHMGNVAVRLDDCDAKCGRAVQCDLTGC